jgi:hypothetical protein
MFAVKDSHIKPAGFKFSKKIVHAESNKKMVAGWVIEESKLDVVLQVLREVTGDAEAGITE